MGYYLNSEGGREPDRAHLLPSSKPIPRPRYEHTPNITICRDMPVTTSTETATTVACRSLHLRRALYILLQYTVTCRSLHLRRPLLRLPADIYFIEHLPNCIVIIVFWVLEGLFILLARYTPSQPSAIYCVNRPHLYSPSLPTLIQAGFLTITAYCRLRIPDLRITPCHSTPPTQR